MEQLDKETELKAILARHGGDIQAALHQLLVLNAYLMRENKRLSLAASPGFMRGSVTHRS
jgi:hypothetical protein